MEPFATVEDYRLRYPGDETPDDVLTECLMDATDVISAELDEHDIDYADPSESFTERLMRVCRQVAHRALGGSGGSDDSDIPFGATQMSQMAQQFQATVSFGNPYGDVFLTESERKRLGIGAARACVLSPYG